MNGSRDVAYELDCVSSIKKPAPEASPEDRNPIPRVARLLALALRFEDLVRSSSIGDYAALARAGHVTRARLTQIMRLRELAPDIQEWILLSGPIRHLNERNLRPVTACVEWGEQRQLFQKRFGIRLTVAPREVINVVTARHQPPKGADTDENQREENSSRDIGPRQPTGRGRRAPGYRIEENGQ